MRSVLVTGGSSGIGSAACRLAAARSWAVHVGYRGGEERARAVADGIVRSGGKAWPVRLPLEETQAAAAAMAHVARTAGRLDALVLCASPAPVLAPFAKTSEEALQEQLRVNVIGNHALIAAAWKAFFAKQQAGHVVAVLSRFADEPPKPQMAPYVLGKRALLALLQCALQELGSSGLRASVVVPGYTETPMLQTLHPHILEAARLSQVDGRFLAAEQVAEKIVDCLDHVPPAPEIARCSLNNDRQ